jgi:polyketide cyclase/dehydrase/lipid transport protein
VRVRASRVLPAPPELVWKHVRRWEEQARWIRDAVWVRVLTEDREGEGVRIKVLNRVFGIPLFTEQLEVVEWDPPATVVMVHRSFVRGVGTWELHVRGEATVFVWAEELWLPIPVLGALALWVYRPFMRRLMEGSLANLQRLIEST